MLTEEEIYVHSEPGAEAKGYFRLGELMLKKRMFINGAFLELINNKLLYDTKVINGIKLQGGYVFLRVEHYGTATTANKIIRDSIIKVSAKDPYSYFAEPGWLSNKTRAEIQRILGIKDKQIGAKLVLIARAPIIRTWIKVAKGKPAKFAIEGNQQVFPVRKGKEIDVYLLS